MDQAVVLALVAVLAGAASGFLSAVFSPFAIRRAEEARLRDEQRRSLIADSRQLVADGNREQWSQAALEQDVRYQALRGHLPGGGKKYISLPPRTMAVEPDGDSPLLPLSEVIDRLEQRWRLI